MTSSIQKIILLLLISNFCSASLPAGYVRQTQEEKMENLWAELSAEPYEKLPSLSKRLFLQAIGASAALNLRPTIDTKSDEMPTGRIKFIHTYGSCAQIELVTVDNPYTGIFKSGAMGVTRLGWAAPPELVGYIPGMAIKFLVDGKPSVNIQVMKSLDGQGKNANYFSQSFSNHIAEPKNAVIGLLALLFKRVTTNPFYLPVDHLAKIEINGEKVENAVFPEEIQFVPRHPEWISSKSKTDLREELVQIKNGSILYDVFGLEKNEKVRIGMLKLKSHFINSEYCDQKLFFQHHTVESVRN